jgi:transposase
MRVHLRLIRVQPLRYLAPPGWRLRPGASPCLPVVSAVNATSFSECSFVTGTHPDVQRPKLARTTQMTDSENAPLHANPGEAHTGEPHSRNRFPRNRKEMERRRRKGMRMLAHGINQADVARELNVSRQTASIWARKLVDGPQAWRSRPLGRPSGLNDTQKRTLNDILVAGAALQGFPNGEWTLARVARVIEREFGLTYSLVNVWRILQKMGFRNAV